MPLNVCINWFFRPPTVKSPTNCLYNICYIWDKVFRRLLKPLPCHGLRPRNLSLIWPIHEQLPISMEFHPWILDIKISLPTNDSQSIPALQDKKVWSFKVVLRASESVLVMLRRTADLSNVMALSYAWGERLPDNPIQIGMYADGKSFMVTEWDVTDSGRAQCD